MTKLTRVLMGVLALCVSSSAFADLVRPVPEPGTFGLLVAGVAGVIAVSRLRRK